ncbi:beta-N-acetylhexosaminidase [Mangrovibacterium diazotrophicum]|uniref:beta-N-acetylhexosaminidase n=1 Tax=Mangrovibacterium diazotrophicum TaxID=1261403 RepID=A0A419VWK1_9BACT|nr:beta-N-acetylhexosaminidase [Mangrovibacterium diazotrophicum]RKD86382.1 hexosaminidase [Mangrovibacterium diazotrophicum]
MKVLCLFLLSFTLGFFAVSAENIRIIPQPKEMVETNDNFLLDSRLFIVSGVESQSTALILREYFACEYGLKLELKSLATEKEKCIRFTLKRNLPSEGYELNVNANCVEISASDNTGWFYAIQSLKQLLPPNDGVSAVNDISIPGVSIKDSPRFPWRAFMLDESRYFKGADQVKMLLDEMASLKMNIFHWHLVDDQGWRIEIKKYPLLTEIGSKRESTQVGPLKWESPIQSGETHEGYYTQDEIKEIINYAAQRHITIVPEIEMPGHSSAAIASYPWLGTAKDEIEVPIRFGVGTDVYDLSDPKVYQFLTDVLDEVIELFPSMVIHIGGDEVKYDHWKQSLSVQAYMNENNLETPADLQVYFTNSISRYLQGKGRRMMGWNEILGHNLHEYQDEADTQVKQKLARQTVIHFWKGDVELISQAASEGYEIVNSLHSYTYLDYDYVDIPLQKAYSFNPIPEELDSRYHDKVIGMGCQMWGEWIPTNGYMHFMVFPRIAAYAEVGWTQIENKNFGEFERALKKMKMHWDKIGVYYAPDSVVGIESEDNEK